MGTYKTDKSWHGIKQTVFAGRVDPDATAVEVKIPAAWGAVAADALAAIDCRVEEILERRTVARWILRWRRRPGLHRLRHGLKPPGYPLT